MTDTNITVATTVAMPSATYAAGTLNQPDTITLAGSTVTIDGFELQNNGTIDTLVQTLIKDESDPKHNGVYNCGQPGGPNTSLVFSRLRVFGGDVVVAPIGTVNARTMWVANYGADASGNPPINSENQANGTTDFNFSRLIPLNGQLAGCAINNNATSPNTKVDIANGNCSDSTNMVSIAGSAQTKDISASWAADSGNGGLFSGSVAASTVYHVFAIRKDSDTSVDFGFDTSVSAANKPSGYTYFRRLGSVITDANSHIIAFHQHGDEFWLDTPVKDVDVTNPGTSAVLRTLTVPTGVQVAAIVNAISYDSTGDTTQYISSPEAVDVAPSYANAVDSSGSDKTVEAVSQNRVWTNTSGQVRTRLSYSSASTAFKMLTLGWVDARGK